MIAFTDGRHASYNLFYCSCCQRFGWRLQSSQPLDKVYLRAKLSYWQVLYHTINPRWTPSTHQMQLSVIFSFNTCHRICPSSQDQGGWPDVKWPAAQRTRTVSQLELHLSRPQLSSVLSYSKWQPSNYALFVPINTVRIATCFTIVIYQTSLML